MKTALYRKYRPQTFDGVIGQDIIVTTLTNQVRKGAVSHAYLFTGSRGTGKTSCAKIFARAINCLSPVNGSPCGKCEVCAALEKSNNLDVLEIDAASNNGVDKIREMLEGINYVPSYGKYKVYIIDEVHMLSNSAFNALLKTLEEPPAHVVFILCTTEVHKIPPTILSRCMRFDFKLVSTDRLAELVGELFEKEGVKATPDALRHIARLGEGSVRDTLSIADRCMSAADELTMDAVLQIMGTGSKEETGNLMKSVIDRDTVGVLRQIEQLSALGKSATQLAKELTIYARDLILIKSGITDGVEAGQDTLRYMTELSERVSTARLAAVIKAVGSVDAELRYSSAPKVVLEGALIGLTETEEQPLVTMTAPQRIVTKTADVAPESAPIGAKTVTPKPEQGRTPVPNEPPFEDVAEKTSAQNVGSIEELLRTTTADDRTLGVLGVIRRKLRLGNHPMLFGEYSELKDNNTRLAGKTFYVFADKGNYLTYAESESKRVVQGILDEFNAGYKLVVTQIESNDTDILKQILEATKGLDVQKVNRYGKNVR